jgi:dipeptidyl aminopeptidase/acylaminoacyl peptidase
MQSIYNLNRGLPMMTFNVASIRILALCGLALGVGSAYSQGTLADYDRAAGLRDKFQGLAPGMPESANWIESTSRFWYRKSVPGGHEYELMDAATLAKRPAFDHEKMAAALSKAAGVTYTATKLPLREIAFVDREQAIEAWAGPSRWKIKLADYSCEKMATLDRDLVAQATPPVAQLPAESAERKAAPDGAWEAFVRNYNVYVRGKADGKDRRLSFDGMEDNAYDIATFRWSPDSKRLVAYRIRRGYHRHLNLIESSPADQLQPKLITLEYDKPGDAVDVAQPELFQVESGKAVAIDNRLFPNPFEIAETVWRKDSRSFTFEYNQRGHQAYRVIEVDAATGNARAAIDEQSPTFFCYSGKMFRHDVEDGKEIVWMSERDGWNHLYLVDGATGKVKNQITRGNWVVRGVEKVDDEKRQIWFRASGMTPGIDPYFVHYYRINFDGSGLTALTTGDANHEVAFSTDMRYYVDTWSRVDLAPVSELHRTEDGKLLVELERGDLQPLLQAGWRAPEPFVAKGRDGVTDIWGVIFRPTNLDPAKEYPVIEMIYAGPQDSFVPKSFHAYYSMQSMAELGFVVVQIDGMGTSNRSKAFHDVAWKNLGDAGFTDRILWHRAVAAKYPYYDIGRVGVYGHSAGGQSALGALLFHPEFYKAAVAGSGCHDNRMDKIWWNEQWMGWPLGPEYEAASNVVNAHRLKGKLLLTVGELDDNVDPSSTMQVVEALIKAHKVFDLLVLPGQGHSPGGAYGERKRFDFFVHNLLGVEPPDWNAMDKTLPEERW